MERSSLKRNRSQIYGTQSNVFWCSTPVSGFSLNLYFGNSPDNETKHPVGIVVIMKEGVHTTVLPAAHSTEVHSAEAEQMMNGKTVIQYCPI